MSEPFFSLNQAAAAAGGFRLGPLSLDLAEGDWFVLLGPSGSGKTTLLGLIAGVRQSPAGMIRLGGRDIGPLPPERRRVAYVSQTGDLFPHLTVAGNVGFGLRFTKSTKKEQAARVEKLLALFGLEALAGQSAATVSGGEGRRVALARALAVEPALLLLDEPLGMLDPPGRRAMQECLARVHKDLGATTLHVTHDLREAKALGSRAGILMGGRLVQEDTVENLFQHPATPETARFLSLEAV